MKPSSKIIIFSKNLMLFSKSLMSCGSLRMRVLSNLAFVGFYFLIVHYVTKSCGIQEALGDMGCSER